MKEYFTFLRTFLILFILVGFQSGLSAQSHGAEHCGFDHVHENALQIDLDYAARVANFNNRFSKAVQNGSISRTSEKADIATIPMVFHIIHRGEPVGQGSNITDEQVISAVDGMNIQYRNLDENGNTLDPDGVDLEIEFCLAQRDPDGNPTNGINRIDGRSVAGYDTDGITSPGNEVQIKDLSRWNNQEYYNVWVVAAIDGQDPFGAGTKGYAYFPGANAQVDGTVVVYPFCGYDPDGSRGIAGNGQISNGALDNGTMVHEIGHAFALYHTFQGASSNGGNCPPAESNCNTDGDRVCDTPPHDSHLGTCKGENDNNMCTGQPYGKVVKNYMNYTNCSPPIYSPGQRDRMRFALENDRPYFNITGTPDACIPVFAYDVSFRKIFNPSGFYCDGDVIGEILVKNNGQNQITSFDIEYGVDGNVLNTFTYTGTLESQDEVTVTLPVVTTTTGNHNFFAQVKQNSINGSNADEFGSNDYIDTDFEVINGSTIEITVADFENGDSFEIIDDNSGAVVVNFSLSNLTSPFTQEFCLPDDGCYFFRYKDATFVHPQFGGTPPSYEIKEPSNGYVIDAGYDSNPLFSGGPYEDETDPFCLPYDPGFLTAAYDLSRTVVAAGNPIDFFDQSFTADGAKPTSWKWDFGDGSTEDLTMNPTHIYNTPGIYNVRLIVDNSIRPDTLVKEGVVRVVPAFTGCNNYANIVNGESATTYQDVDGNGGTFPGKNDFGITEYAERFYIGQPGKLISVTLGIENIVTDDDARNLLLKIYAGNFDGTAPVQLLQTQSVPLNNLSTGSNKIELNTFQTVDQFYFVSYSLESDLDDVVLGTANYRGEENLSNTVFAKVNGNWSAIENVIDGTEATSLDMVAELSFIPNAVAYSNETKICANLPFDVFGDLSENANSTLWKFPNNATKSFSNSENETVSFIEGGDYDIYLVVTGGCNIKDSALVEVLVDSIPSVEMVVTDELCNKGNGTATAVMRGGSGNGSFTWSYDPSYKGNVHSNAGAGTYTYTWSDDACMINDVEEYTIENVDRVPEFTAEAEPTSCGFDNGIATALTDGLADYEYSWTYSGDAGFANTSQAISNLAPGTYTVTVSLNGCTSVRTEVVEVEPSRLVEGTVSEVPRVCENIEVVLNANKIEADSVKWFTLDGNLFAGDVDSVVIDTNRSVQLKVVFYGDPGCTLDRFTGVTILPNAIARSAVSDGVEDYGDTTYLDLNGGALAFFSSSGTTSNGLTWDFGDGTTTTDRNPFHEYQEIGEYEVRLFARNAGCDDVDTNWVFVEDTRVVGINDIQGNAAFKMYPNPASQSLFLEVGETLTNTNYEILDLAGKTLRQGRILKQVQEIDLNEMKNGMYFIRIHHGSKQLTEKFSIIR